MSSPLLSGKYVANDADLSSTQFVNSNLSDTTFHDVNLKHSSFENVALSDSTFTDVCLKNVVISNANCDGMTIDGVLITELFRVFRKMT